MRKAWLVRVFFPATVHAALTATERRSYHVIQKNGPESILGNLLSVSAGIGHRRFEVLAKYEVARKLLCLSLFPGIYCVYFLAKFLVVLSKHVTLKCSFKPNVTIVFVFNQICSHVRSNLNIEHSAQLRSILDLQFLGHCRTNDFEKLKKTELKLNLQNTTYYTSREKNMQISLRVNRILGGGGENAKGQNLKSSTGFPAVLTGAAPYT